MIYTTCVSWGMCVFVLSQDAVARTASSLVMWHHRTTTSDEQYNTGLTYINLNGDATRPLSVMCDATDNFKQIESLSEKMFWLRFDF